MQRKQTVELAKSESENLAKYLSHVTKVKASLDGYTASLKKMGAASQTTSSVISTLGSTLTSALTGFGIMAGINLLIQGITYLATAGEKAKQETQEIAESSVSSFSEAQNSLHAQKQLINSVSEEYALLAQGVDESGNNLALTTEQYARYNEIVNQIAGTFPNLVKDWTDSGAAIMKHKGDVEELTKAYKANADAANANLLLDGSKIMNNYYNQMHSVDNDKHGGYADWSEVLGKIIPLMEASEAGDTSKEFELQAAILDLEQKGQLNYLLEILRQVGYSDSEINDDKPSNYRNLLHTNFTEIKAFAKKCVSTVNAETANVRSLASAYIGSNNSYQGLTPEQKSAVDQAVTELDDEFFLQFGNDRNAMYTALNNIIKNVQNQDIEPVDDHTIVSLSTMVSKLSEAENKLKAIGNAMSQIQSNGYLDSSTLNDFYTSFQDVPDVDRYINRIANATSADAAVSALTDLATAYLNTSDTLDGLNEQNKKVIVAQLQAMGVTNAQELVEKKLTAQRVQAMIASFDFNTQTKEEYVNLLLAADASYTAEEAIAHYSLTQQTAKLAADDFNNATNTQIQELKRLAQQAGLTGDALAAIERIEYLKDQKESISKRGVQYKTDQDFLNNYDSNMAEAEKQLQDALAKTEDLKPTIKISTSQAPAVSSSGNKSYAQTDKYKEKAEAEIKSLKHRLAMGKITQKAYYDELDRINKKYYHNKSKYQQEDWQNEEEILQGRMSLYQEAYDQLNALVDKQVEKIKSEKEAEKKVLQDKLNNLKEFYDKQKQMLRDQADEDQYEKEQAEKRKTVTELELEIQALSRSTSARDRKLLAEKRQELADAREELRDFEKERALDEAEKAIDLQYEKDEERINKDIEKIDQYLENQYKIQQDALNELKQIKNFSKQSALYKEMRDWNRQNGTGKDADIDELFSNVAAINKAFGNGTFGGAMSYLQGQIKNTKRSFAGGTAGAPAGLALVDEQGYEVKLGNPSAGKYQFLNDGDIVFTRAESRFLKRLTGSGGASLIGERLAGLLRRGANALSPLTAAAMAGQSPVAIRTGDIVINGDANKRTIAQIKAAQKDMTYQILRQFQKLK